MTSAESSEHTSPLANGSEDEGASDTPTDELPGRRLRAAPAEPTPAQRRKLVEGLVERGFAASAAEAAARSIEDPKGALEQLKAPAEFGVHGGTIKYITTRVLNGTVLPIPTNPRVAGEVNYAAGGTSSGGIEALDVEGLPDHAPGLTILSRSPVRLRSDMTTAADFVRANNKLIDSISSHGVLLPTTIVPVQFTFADGSAARDILCTVDGSSRLTAALDIWGMSPSEVLFDLTDSSALRSRLNEVRALLEVDELMLTDEDRAKLRSRTLPAQLIVGWEPEEDGLGFPELLDAYLGLIHVEPPTPWGEAASQDSRAEAVLDELVRLGRFDEERRRYLAGHLSPEESTAAGFDPSLDGRSAAVFYELDRRWNVNAVNRALRRIGMKRPDREDRLAVATELAMRPYRRLVPDLNRRNPRQALPAAMESLRPQDTGWSPSNLEPSELLTAALDELADGSGKANRAELAARGAFWLTRYSCLQKSSRTDPRLANEVLRELQGREHGLRCLYQAIIDGRNGVVPRQVREDGSVLTIAGGVEPDQTDRWLRETFPKSDGSTDDDTSDEDDDDTPPPPEPEPADVLRDRIYSLRDEVSTIGRRVSELDEVEVDGQPLVDVVGIATDIVEEVAGTLDRARLRVAVLGDVWRRTSDTSAG